MVNNIDGFSSLISCCFVSVAISVNSSGFGVDELLLLNVDL